MAILEEESDKKDEDLDPRVQNERNLLKPIEELEEVILDPRNPTNEQTEKETLRFREARGTKKRSGQAACPKDCFALPQIDQLVDATAGHELMSFMDAYSGYNQIKMHVPDQEHTSFVTTYKVMLFGLKNAGNFKTDVLAKLASQNDLDELNLVPVEVLSEASICETKDVEMIDSSPTWTTPIINYLLDRKLPNDKNGAQKLLYSVPRYTIIEGKLYRKGYSMSLLRCVLPTEANEIIREIHEGFCRDHAGWQSLSKKIIRQGYYWPMINKDTHEFVKKCDKCQRRGGAKYAVVAVNFFSKWMEVEPLVSITCKKVLDFVVKNIVCRFGIPIKIVSDKENLFDGDLFTEFCERNKIIKSFSSVARPQANGQVEGVNKTLKDTIKKKLDAAKGRWVDELPQVLWAHIITEKTATGHTPFSLAFGSEAMLPVEVNISTQRRELYNQEENLELLKFSLDLLDEKRAESQITNATYQHRVTRYFNKRVKKRLFNVGDLVLR
ncbi:uncharacterized protein LOC133039709 [Cannabis sativa]|uniref:uncharacterized protein LOC133039709 n=1 Tax=Cannabis sativa TaxID=3483 RepID=UPI0029CA3F5C|nr:uncharacterized protein LOC133039709 [Cannabis sativa]